LTIILEFLLLVLFILISMSFGNIALTRLRVKCDTLAQETIFSLALGLMILSYSVFFLSVVGLIYRWLLVILLVVMAFVSARWSYSLLSRLWDGAKKLKLPSLLESAFLLVIVGYALTTFVVALAPPTKWDTLYYHLVIPKIYLQHHAMVPLMGQGSMGSVGFELLYTLAMSVGRDNLSVLLQFASGLGAAVAVYVFAGHYLSFKTAIMAMAVFYCEPVVAAIAGTAKTDMGVVLYAVLAVYAFCLWWDQRTYAWLMISAVLTGGAIAGKLTSLVLFGSLAVALLWDLWAHRPRSLSSIKPVVLYFLIVLALTLPWMVRTCLWTGDPLYPYLTDLLAGNELGTLGDRKTFWDFLLLPWTLTFKVIPLGSEPGSPIYLAFLPGLFLAGTVPKRFKLLLWISFAYVCFFFFLWIRMRYLLPALALLSIVVAWEFERLFLKKATFQFAALLLLLPLIFNLQHYFRDTIPGVSAVVLGKETREQYLSRTLPFYDMCTYINANLPQSARIISLWEVRTYYCDREVFSPNAGGDLGLKKWDWYGKQDAEEILNVLQSLGVTHILISWWFRDELVSLYEKGLILDHPDEHILLRPEIMKHYTLVHSIRNTDLFRFEGRAK
jgi:hypothetical protein